MRWDRICVLPLAKTHKDYLAVFHIVFVAIVLFVPSGVSASETSAGDESAAEITEDQSVPEWRYQHTPMAYRLGVFAGDQAGGPVRYNTQFPEVKGDPHPASYYHGAGFGGVEIEKTFAKGGMIFAFLTRRDFAHRGIVGRQIQITGEDWEISDFSYSGNALAAIWALGSRYREALWTVDLGVVYDRGSVQLKMSRISNGTAAVGEVNAEALSFRSRVHFGFVSSRSWQMTCGPEFHVPLWQRISNRSDSEIRAFTDQTLQVKSAAAVGLGLMASIRI